MWCRTSLLLLLVLTLWLVYPAEAAGPWSITLTETNHYGSPSSDAIAHFVNSATHLYANCNLSSCSGLSVDDQTIIYADAYAGTVTSTGGFCETPLCYGLAWYGPMDENIGTSVFDLAGNTYTGTLTNGAGGSKPTWATGGSCVAGSCLNFVASNKPYVSIPNIVALRGTTTVSVVAWASVSSDSGAAMALGCINGVNSASGAVMCPFVATSTLHLRLLFEWSDGTTTNYDSGIVLSTGTFYMLAGTYDGSQIVGYACTASSCTTGTPQSITKTLSTSTNLGFIGATSGSANFFNGNIDDFRVYTNVLPVSQLSELARLSIPTTLERLASSSTTYTFDYYSTHLQTESYSVTGGGTPSPAPTLSFSEVGSVIGTPLTLTTGAQTIWADDTSWTVSGTISGAANEQWDIATNTGTYSSSGTKTHVYYHQYQNNWKYAVTYGGSPTAPVMTCNKVGSAATLTLTTSNQLFYCDANTVSATATDPIAGVTGERWSNNGQSQAISSGGNTYTFNEYHQYQLTASYSVSDSSSPTAPMLACTRWGSASSDTLTKTATAYWEDNSSVCTITNPLSGSGSNERWLAYSSISLTISGAASTAPLYYHQYSQSVSMTITCLSFTSTAYIVPDTACPYPLLSYKLQGATASIVFTSTPQTIWADAGSAASAPYVISDPAGDNYQANINPYWTISAHNVITSPAYSYLSFTEQNVDYQALWCQSYPINIFAGSLYWEFASDSLNVTIEAPSYVYFNGFSQSAGGPGYAMGVGCDAGQPSADITIKRVDASGVLLVQDGTSQGGSLYGVFYYGYMGEPAEATFNYQIAIESASYYTNYASFTVASAPAVYWNHAGHYVEWKLAASVSPQAIYFTSVPTHVTSTTTTITTTTTTTPTTTTTTSISTTTTTTPTTTTETTTTTTPTTTTTTSETTTTEFTTTTETSTVTSTGTTTYTTTITGTSTTETSTVTSTFTTTFLTTVTSTEPTTETTTCIQQVIVNGTTTTTATGCVTGEGPSFLVIGALFGALILGAILIVRTRREA